MSVGSIVLGSFRSCFVGLLGEPLGGRPDGDPDGPRAGRLTTRSARSACTAIEVNIRPENTASLAVVRKLGFRTEGRAARTTCTSRGPGVTTCRSP